MATKQSGNIKESKKIEILNPYRLFLEARKNYPFPSLVNSIFVLDSCAVGFEIHKFRKPHDIFGCIGFDDDADWIDSTIFILALLAKMASRNLFVRSPGYSHVELLEEMQQGAYAELMKMLGVSFDFSKSQPLPAPV